MLIFKYALAVACVKLVEPNVEPSNLIGSRASKVGAAMRKIPTGIQHRGPQPKTAALFTPYRLNNGLRSVPAINNPPGQAV